MRKKSILVTPERLRECLSYNPETGEIKRLNGRSGKRKTGRFTEHGYISVAIDKKLYYAHRLAFVFMTGKWPNNYVDHINGIGTDNRWSNLRDVTAPANALNVWRPGRPNKYGFRGIYLERKSGKFKAEFQAFGKKVCLGTFDTAFAAGMAYKEAKEKHLNSVLGVDQN